MARRKRPMKSLLMQTNPSNPVQTTPSSQEIHPGHSHADQEPVSVDSKTSSSPSISRLAISYGVAELTESGHGFPSGAVDNGHFHNGDPSMWCSNEDIWQATGDPWNNDLFTMLDEPSLIASRPSRPQMHNDVNVSETPFLLEPAPEAWESALYVPGHNTHRMQDVLVGIPDSQCFPENYQGHPMMQDIDGSDMSSLSSSYHYSVPDPQPSVAGHMPSSHVPWSRPETLGKGLAGRSPWNQNSEIPAHPMISMIPERSYPGMQVRISFWIGWKPLKIVHLFDVLSLLTKFSRRAVWQYLWSHRA